MPAPHTHMRRAVHAFAAACVLACSRNARLCSNMRLYLQHVSVPATCVCICNMRACDRAMHGRATWTTTTVTGWSRSSGTVPPRSSFQQTCCLAALTCHRCETCAGCSIRSVLYGHALWHWVLSIYLPCTYLPICLVVKHLMHASWQAQGMCLTAMV